MKKEDGQQDESFKEQQQLGNNESQQELQYDTNKKLALEAMQGAVRAIQQIISKADNQSLQQATKRLQEAIKQLNDIQDISVAHSATVEQQQLAQVQQQIDPIVEVLQQIQSLDSGTLMRKKSPATEDGD